MNKADIGEEKQIYWQLCNVLLFKLKWQRKNKEDAQYVYHTTRLFWQDFSYFVYLLLLLVHLLEQQMLVLL